jgi:hypothetical protein
VLLSITIAFQSEIPKRTAFLSKADADAIVHLVLGNRKFIK